MLGTILSWMNFGVLGVLPWFSWVILGCAGGIACMFLLPPSRLTMLVAMGIVLVVSSVGVKSWGYQEGITFQKVQDKKDADAERERLDHVFAEVGQSEYHRASAMSSLETQLQEARDNALLTPADAGLPATDPARTMPVDPNGNLTACSLGLGPTGAGRLFDLYSLGRRKSSPPRRTKRP